MTTLARITDGIRYNETINGEFEVYSPFVRGNASKREGRIGVIIDGTRVSVQVDSHNVNVIEGGYRVDGEPTLIEPHPVQPQETIEEMTVRINQRFEVMDLMTEGVIKGAIKGLIISGAPGVGKTFELERKLTKATDAGEIESTILAGKSTAICLYEKLYQHSEEGCVLVLDDIDDIFTDETALNILKAALDTGETRRICWNSASKYLEENDVPTMFEFEGTVIFISNLNFDKIAGSNSRLAPHIDALLSRCVYLDLGVHTKQEIMVRIRQVVFNSLMLQSRGLDEDQIEEVVAWVEEHMDRLRNLSLRTLLHIATFVQTDATGWKSIAEVTMLRP